MESTSCCISFSIPLLSTNTLTSMFFHVILRIMSYQQLVLYILNIFNKSRPRFVKLSPLSRSALLELFGCTMVLGQLAIFAQTYAGYRDSIYAVMHMIDTLLLGIVLLNSPYLPKIRSGNTFHYIYLLED